MCTRAAFWRLGWLLVWMLAAPGVSLDAAPPASQPPAARLAVDPLDWPMWRGPEQNGISRETNLPDTWDPSDEASGQVLWKRDDLGGISTPIVMHGRVYTIVRSKPETPAEGEKVVCVDAASGKTVWERLNNVFLSDCPAERIGWSCVVGDPAENRLFSCGANGYFQCLDAGTGDVIWSRPLNEEFGLLSTYGGRLSSPAVFEDLVYMSAVIVGWGEMARPAHRFIAFNKHTGEPIWFNGTTPLPEDTTFSTPVFTVLNGQAAMVVGSGDGYVYAFQPRTGKMIWRYRLSRRGLNLTPFVQDGRVYMGHAEENDDNTLGAIVVLDATKSGDITSAGPLWRAEGMTGKGSPVMFDGRVYIPDDGGKLYVLDAKTGEEVCHPIKLIGTIVRASPVVADGKIYLCSTSGWHTFQIVESGLKPIQKLRLPQEDEVTGSIAISHGRIYLPTRAHLYCIGPKEVKPQAASRPNPPVELPAGKDDQPAQIQLTPVESLLKPGEKLPFSVRSYNARGQLLGRVNQATFSLDGPGAIDAKGLFTAAPGKEHTATIVTAKLGNASAQARLRVVPPLPWKFDFTNKEVPITWIGARYRHQFREVDGEPAIVKITTIPKGTRSQLWMGPHTLHDYTIQADYKAAKSNQKLPDMGLVAQRYTMDLMGQSQQVQLRSWTSQLGRFSKNVPFSWKEGVWYTLKFRAATDDGKAVLQGKVWERGQPEPAAWTIEATDEYPNLTGSPGLFGNANDSEITIDNVLVTPNT